MSLEGLRYAMQSALEAHRTAKRDVQPLVRPKPRLAEDYPAAKRLARGECIHCHQVAEFHRAQQQARGAWGREDRWTFPLPENIGLTLDSERGNHVRTVRLNSPAHRTGLKAGDVLRAVAMMPIASEADLQYALHRGPWEGKLRIDWTREGKQHSGELQLAKGWKKTNLTWRPSLLELLPSLTVYGEDLSALDKKRLGFSDSRLAFRQEPTVHSQARKAGVMPNDIILGLEGDRMEGTMQEFLAHVRRNYLVGDRVTLLILREGKTLRLPLTLR